MLPLLVALQLVAPPDRIAVLRTWVEAVEQHQPGQRDEPLEAVRELNTPAWEVIARHMPSLVKVIWDPRASVFLEQSRGRDRLPRMTAALILEADEMTRLRDLATEVRSRGSANRFLKRAAMLHTDLALSGDTPAAPSAALRAAGLTRVSVVIEDGKPSPLHDGISQWAMARLMLGEVRSRPNRDPDPQKDPDVLLWYQATTAHLLNLFNYQEGQFERAVELFPGEAGILFAAGAAKDMASASGINAAERSVRRGLAAQGAEARQAAALYRRALGADRGHAEARIRLAHLLIRQGDVKDAVGELRAAIPLAADPLRQYFAHLFLGRALGETGDVAGARAAYERALVLQPAAQSPRVGLSQLLTRTGEREAALQMLRPALASEAGDEDEPMWNYYTAAGREGDILMERAYRALAPTP